MTRKKIAVIGLKGLPAFGGAATVGENIIDQLKDKYDFTVYAVASHTSHNGYQNGYRQIVFKSFRIKKLNIFLYYLKSALHALFVGNYQLIHLHHVDGGFILPLLRIRYKVIGTSHARPYFHDKWSPLAKVFLKFSESVFFFFSNAVTAVALPLKDSYSQSGRDEKEIRYIPNGISLNQPVTDAKGYLKDDYIMYAAGRIIPSKGCHILLEALIKIGYKGKVIIAGDVNQLADYKARLMDDAAKLNVQFIGLIKNKPELLGIIKNAKLFIYPSMYEAMSIMLLETVFVKTPLICSDIPENTAIFDPGELLFFKSNDSADLSEKVTWALNHSSEMNDNAQKAYQKLVTNYNWENIASRYSDLFDKYLN